ncbi:hypothetical protein [Streptomyces montanus]|uniref:hypothetical protein n=1 Tax=Streptomyces montanus TaxID=2580423 RepID=UPI001BB1D505|nr:hypothetical protein [Streptomyces montanus]
MTTEGWLEDTRTSYDTVATSYADQEVAAWLNDAGFTVEARMTLTSAESTLGGILFARRRPDTQ